MIFVTGVLTFILVLICLFLILLVLVQLPKKDAGAGMAFGGGTADALFGSGSGNVLTKITKYTAIVFLGMALLISTLQSHVRTENSGADFAKMVETKQQQSPAIPTPQPAKAPAAPNNLLSATLPTATNAPMRSATNQAK
jgi:preprotein translocase subunit SecG